MIQKEALNRLGENIQKHISLYPKLSVKAEQFESLFACATGSDWKPYNHNPGSDMNTTIDKIRTPSLKSGVLKKGYLVISSHRTTKYRDLQEKINFLCSTDYDSYICLARPNNKVHDYKLVYFTKSLIDFRNLNWSVTQDKKRNPSGWSACNNDGTIKVNIHKSMSDQVWIEIHESLITIIEQYQYDVRE